MYLLFIHNALLLFLSNNFIQNTDIKTHVIQMTVIMIHNAETFVPCAFVERWIKLQSNFHVMTSTSQLWCNMI